MSFKEETIWSKEIFRGKMINLDLLGVLLPDGKESTREIVRHPGASVIIPLKDNGEIYMVKQYRKPIEKMTWELPAGKLDPGETPEQCAIRELREETGLSAGKLSFLLKTHSAPGFSDEILYLYVATQLSVGQSNTDEDEFISLECIHIKNLCDMVFKGEITDAKTIIGILAVEKVMNSLLDI